jgi:hypothetical protein
VLVHVCDAGVLSPEWLKVILDALVLSDLFAIIVQDIPVLNVLNGLELANGAWLLVKLGGYSNALLKWVSPREEDRALNFFFLLGLVLKLQAKLGCFERGLALGAYNLKLESAAVERNRRQQRLKVLLFHSSAELAVLFWVVLRRRHKRNLFADIVWAFGLLDLLRLLVGQVNHRHLWICDFAELCLRAVRGNLEISWLGFCQSFKF